MESHLSEEALWASGLASRLRLIQANFADDPSSERREHIIEEIERALSSISPTRRKSYLDSLAERFPAWEGVRSTAENNVQTPVAAALLTPEELVAKLIEVAPTLSPEARADFARKLQAVGLVIKQSAEVPLEAPPELQKRLGLAAGKPLQPERAVKLLSITTELMLTLDQLAWALWKQLAPKSSIRKDGEVSRLAGAYLGGDGEVSSTQVTQTVEKTRRLVAGLLGAVGKAGSTYAMKFASVLSPEQIEDFARMEKRPFEGMDAACWRKYLQQAKDHASEGTIEHEIQEAIAQAAEKIILGRMAT
jgi:hypothetical protein